MARPRTGETPIRHVRVSGELWGRVGDIADRQGRTLSAVVVDALERYADAELGEPSNDADRAGAAEVELTERRARKGGRPRKAPDGSPAD